MPTKERRKKQKSKAKEWAKFGPVPEYMQGARRTLVTEALLTTPKGQGIYKRNLVKFDGNGHPYLQPNIGKGGNDRRQADRRDEALALQQEYSAIWGQRGAPKRIALDKGLNTRTVQKYFRDFPKE